MYHLVTGRLPFEGPASAIPYRITREDAPPPSRYCPDLDPALERVILKAVARNPEARYQTGREFRAALDGWSAGASPQAGVTLAGPRAAGCGVGEATPAPREKDTGSPAGTGYQEDIRGDDGGVLLPIAGEAWPSVDCDAVAPVVYTSSTSATTRGAESRAANARWTLAVRLLRGSEACRGAVPARSSSRSRRRLQRTARAAASRSDGTCPRVRPRSRSPGTNVIASTSGRAITSATIVASVGARSRRPRSFHAETSGRARAS